jgi:AraC-like DNA-binding protein
MPYFPEMNYTYHPDCHELWATEADLPSPPFPIRLRAFPAFAVEQAFVVSNCEKADTPTIILPDLSAHLVIHQLADGNIRGSLIGPRTRSLMINRQHRRKTFILRFEATAPARYLPFPVCDLTDRSIPLGDLSSAEAFSFENVRQDSPGKVFKNMLGVLQSLERDTSASELIIARRFLQARSTDDTVRKRARRLGLSERYLQRILRSRTGLSPKMALRILRLRRSLITRQQNRKLSWAGIAHQSGYFDQSHMIDEYQRFLGTSPDRLFFGSKVLQST